MTCVGKKNSMLGMKQHAEITLFILLINMIEVRCHHELVTPEPHYYIYIFNINVK